jgi:hypothetical protein
VQLDDRVTVGLAVEPKDADVTKIDDRVTVGLAVEVKDADVTKIDVSPTVLLVRVSPVVEVESRDDPKQESIRDTDPVVAAKGGTREHTTRVNAVEKVLVTKEEAAAEFLLDRTAMGSTQ